MQAAPLVPEIRQHRATLATLMRELRLQDSMTAAKKSSQAPDYEETLSERNRRAVRARWEKHRSGDNNIVELRQAQ